MKKFCILSLSLILVFVFAGCASRVAVDPEVFKTACTDLGFEISETTDAATLASGGVSVFIGATADKGMAELVVFDTEATAKSTYAQFLSSIDTTDGTEEKRVDSATYCKYMFKGSTTYSALVRIGNSVFFSQGDTADGIVQKLVEKIGYK